MLPDDCKSHVCVRVSALTGGKLTLPEKLFVTDADEDKRATVPSMCFLIEHPNISRTGKPTRIVLDLGLKRDLDAYQPAMRNHISNRHPISVSPDVRANLEDGGLSCADDIDIIMYTHIHWDHVGTPSDYPNSTFVVGSGTLHLLKNGAPPHYPAEIFDPHMLDGNNTQELPPVHAEDDRYATRENQTGHIWESMFGLPAVCDYFDDGSVLIVDSPGHLRGHINLLVRVDKSRYIYLGGDCCHDVRILEGTKGIALYDDGHGQLRSVHMNTDAASDSIRTIQKFLAESSRLLPQDCSVEPVIAHDAGWMERNRHRFFPRWM